MKYFNYSRRKYEIILKECSFTDEELKVITLKRKGKTNMEISIEINICESNVHRRTKSITSKIEEIKGLLDNN